MNTIKGLQNVERKDSCKTKKILKMRNKVLNYLYNCGFVHNYVKKLMYREDIDNLYDDFVQETFLQLCEVKEEKWEELMYNNDNSHDEYYQVRNWVSMLIRNTVRSTTSTAFRRLKKQATVTQQCDDSEWHYLANTVEDTGLKLY